MLLDNGANPDLDSPLSTAALSGSREICQLLIDNLADVDFQDLFGRTPLFYASDLSICNFLIDNGADVNVLAENNLSPLLHHVYSNHYEICESLLDNGAYVNA